MLTKLEKNLQIAAQRMEQTGEDPIDYLERFLDDARKVAEKLGFTVEAQPFVHRQEDKSMDKAPRGFSEQDKALWDSYVDRRNTKRKSNSPLDKSVPPPNSGKSNDKQRIDPILGFSYSKKQSAQIEQSQQHSKVGRLSYEEAEDEILCEVLGWSK